MAFWDPLRELEQLRREMDRISESVVPSRPWTVGFLPGRGARQYPRLNVAETAEGYVAEALAPGIDPQTLDLNVKENVLTIAGEKSAPEGVKAEAVHRSERSAGRFVRTLELPAEIDADKVKASYSDGILRVVLPKAEQTEPRRIDVEVG